MFGATMPTNPMIPTKLVTVAVMTATINSVFMRKRVMFTPTLFARSSPSRRAVSFQASLSNRIPPTKTTAEVIATVFQVAFVKLPNSQNNS